jgi:hypothetical protein
MNTVEICNLALARIGGGASRPLVSIDDASEDARACKRVFAPLLRSLLREYQWPFALRTVELSPSSSTVPGWTHVYAVPVDALNILAVTAPDTDPWGVNARYHSRGFRLIGNVLACHESPACAWYTADIVDPVQADDLFKDALAWRLAAELALTLKAEATLHRVAMEQAQMALSRAVAAMANEGRDDTAWEAETIWVRG